MSDEGIDFIDRFCKQGPRLSQHWYWQGAGMESKTEGLRVSETYLACRPCLISRESECKLRVGEATSQAVGGERKLGVTRVSL